MLIRVLADGKPCAGLLLMVIIKVTRKNNFDLIFGPSGEDGSVSVSRDDLLREADVDRDLFLMDYGHPEGDFAGEIVVRAMNRVALQRALAAFEDYSHLGIYPPGYLERLQRTQMVLERLKPGRLSVEVLHTGEGIVVREEAIET